METTDKEDEDKPKPPRSDEEYCDYADVCLAEVCRRFSSSAGSSSTSGSDIGAARQHNPHASGSQQQGFAVKLHYMISDVEASGDSSIVSWQPHGRCFVVHDRQAFVERVLPSYFMQSTFASFQRQCNLYGFKRISSSQDKGGYYHELFLRSKPDLAAFIQRIKRKGKGPRKPDNPETEPDFYSMKFLPSSSPPTTSSAWSPPKRRRERAEKYSNGTESPPLSSHRPPSVPPPRSGPEYPPYWYHGSYPPYHHAMQPQLMLHAGHPYPHPHPMPYPSRDHYTAYNRGHYPPPPPYHPYPARAESSYENHHQPPYPPGHYYASSGHGSRHGAYDPKSDPHERSSPQSNAYASPEKYAPDVHGAYKEELQTHDSHRPEDPISLSNEPHTVDEPVSRRAVWGDPPGAQEYIPETSNPRVSKDSVAPREVVGSSGVGFPNPAVESSTHQVLADTSWHQAEGHREDDFWSRMVH